MPKIKMEITKSDKEFLRSVVGDDIHAEVRAIILSNLLGSHPHLRLLSLDDQTCTFKMYHYTSSVWRTRVKTNETVYFTKKQDVLDFIFANYGYNYREEAERVFGKAHIFYQDDEVTEFRNFVQIRTNDNILFQVVAVWKQPTTEANKRLKDHGAYYAIFSNMAPSEIRVVFE
jgi:hypothetical protein